MELIGNFYIKLILIVLLVLMVVTVISAYNKIVPITMKEKQIPKFSVDATFDPYPRTINIENKFNCNATSLHKCDVNDATTLFGCKELLVKCHHFEKDVQYLSNKKLTTIPKNATETEGYALPITVASEACNPYHGDLTLVATDVDSSEYMLICICKTPGYIGNDDILGACDKVRLCNGKVNDLNRPLEEIECVCDKYQISKRYDDGLPVCRTLTIQEANSVHSDWSHLVHWRNNRLLSTDAFAKTIQSNLNTSKLLDPCRNDILELSEIVGGSYSSIMKSCRFQNHGIPITTNLLDGPADSINGSSSNRKLIAVDGAVDTVRYHYLRFSDNIDKKRSIAAVRTQVRSGQISKLKNKSITYKLPIGIGVGMYSQIYIKDFDKEIVCPRCEDHLFHYTCELNKSDNLDYKYVQGFPISVPQSSSILVFSKSFWKTAESLMSDSITDDKTKPSLGISLNSVSFTKLDPIKAYGVLYSDVGDSGILSFVNEVDYRKHKNSITE